MSALSSSAVAIEAQPDETTCGPTCLHAVYRFHGATVDVAALVDSVPSLPDGGTLEVLLACDALRRGYRVAIHTYNLNMFDPTWFSAPGVDIAERLALRAAGRQDPKLAVAVAAYREFLARGGRLYFGDLTRAMLRGLLGRGEPVIAALNLTYLYRQARVSGPHDEPDDIHGEPCGHFVVLNGYDRAQKTIGISDPYQANPVAEGQHYAVHVDRVIGAILLGVMTYDASLLVIQKPR